MFASEMKAENAGQLRQRQLARRRWGTTLGCFAFVASAYAFAGDITTQPDSIANATATAALPTSDSAETWKRPSRWKLALEAIALGRSNSSTKQTLVSKVPGTESFLATTTAEGTEALNSNQFQQGVAVGPKFTATYQVHPGYEWELTYFNVLNLHASMTIGPENPLNWYVMKAPGTFPSFWQTQDFPNQGMTWGSTTNLYNAELNARFANSKHLNWMAGFRWIQVNDSLVGSLTPADRNVPAWKAAPYPCGFSLDHPTLVEINGCPGAAGAAVSGYPPFWVTSTTNNLFGLQAGAEGIVLESGPWSLGGAFKAGIYANRATQSAWVSMQKQVYYASATRSGSAFAGEGRIEVRYLIGTGVAVKLGYEFLWLDRIALAPGQISQTYSGLNPTSETATGVNTGSNVLFQGATLGMEYAF